MGVHVEPPHSYFWLVYDLCDGNPLLHYETFEKLKKTPYVWVMAYIDKKCEIAYNNEHRNKKKK